MNKKSKYHFKLKEVIILILVTSFVVALSTGLIVSKRYKNNYKDFVVTDKNISKFLNAYQVLNDNYYQDIDKVQGQSNALKVTKKLFVKQGNSMLPLEQTQLKKGDKVITRLVVTTDRNLEFVALKDLRASCFEPVNQLSGCEWKESLCYYQTTKDASTQFFFSFLPKGTYVFEYEMWANNAGAFTSGIATIQCQYAPEFVSHTGGEIIRVK